MNIALLGFDVDGHASYEYFSGQGHNITICDQNTDLVVPEGVPSVLGEGYLDNLDRFDLLVRTAGLPPSKILAKNPDVGPKITTVINEFFKVCPTKNIIGVTGTKGKGTTSTLITKMLEADGKQVFLGGNIGVPPLQFLPHLTSQSWVILELSSFQLSDINYSPHIGVCLMMASEHLNWHADLNEYIAAKQHLFAKQNADDYAIYLEGNEMSRNVASVGAGKKVPYFAEPGAFVDGDQIKISDQVICNVSEVKLLGEYNLQNVCAAVTAIWPITQNVEAIKSVIATFSGLEHRLEFVRELDGVKYYDDSFGTTPETAIVATKAFREPKILILGGSDKGADYTDLASTVNNNNVKKVLLIGNQAGRIQASLEDQNYLSFVPGGSNMTEIISNARAFAESGDIVLLSTACASFDMFKDYKDRGNQFKQAVLALV